MNAKLNVRTSAAMVGSLLVHGVVVALILNPFDWNLLRENRSTPLSTASSVFDVEVVLNEPRVTRTGVRRLAPAVVKKSVDDVASDTSLDGQGVEAQHSNEPTRGGVLSPEQQYLAEVRRMLESKKNYPIAARRLGHQGRVIVRFVVGRDGQILEAKITEASTSDILNRAARALIENIGGLKPFPSEIRLAEWAVVVPIEYQM